MSTRPTKAFDATPLTVHELAGREVPELLAIRDGCL